MAYVGSTLVDATPEQALAAVVGYSTFNDVTSGAPRSSPASGFWARTATTPARSARWSRPPRSATCATGSASGRGSTARLVQDGSTAEMVYPSATPCR